MGCHFLLQGGLPDPGIEPRSLTLQADALPSEPSVCVKVAQPFPTLCDPMDYTVCGIL